MAVIDWLCDCCGKQFGIDDGRVMFMKHVGIVEDRCEKCISHLIHCMEESTEIETETETKGSWGEGKQYEV